MNNKTAKVCNDTGINLSIFEYSETLSGLFSKRKIFKDWSQLTRKIDLVSLLLFMKLPITLVVAQNQLWC